MAAEVTGNGVLEVMLYERPGCHLCDEAAIELASLAERLGVRLVRVNIEADPALEARFGRTIPVVMVNGTEVARAPIDLETVTSAIESARIDRRRGRI